MPDCPDCKGVGYRPIQHWEKESNGARFLVTDGYEPCFTCRTYGAVPESRPRIAWTIFDEAES